MRIGRWTSSLVAIVFMAILYPYTFRAWFQADDLGWLGLGQHLTTFNDWLGALFAPLAQGTIRPLSERAFYLAGSSLFGLNALPYRVAIFAVQAANVVLLSLISARLTGSGLWAPILWVSNIALAALMTWTGSCSEVFCALFLLLGFYSFLQGRTAAHWVFYLMAMGALEITVMYPLAVCAYAWLFARDQLKRVLPMWIPAVLYTVVHELVRTPPKTHVYDLHFDLSMATTLVKYVSLTLGPGAAAETFSSVPAGLAWAATVPMVLCLIAFVYLSHVAGDRLPLFGLIWFVAFLVPFLPVRDHVTNYYLTIPTLGLALAATSAIRNAPRAVAAVCILLYLGFSIPNTRLNGWIT